MSLQDGQYVVIGGWKATYRVVLVRSTFLSRQHISVNLRNHLVGINRQLGLKWVLSQRIHGRTDLTYVEDLKDPDEVQFPTRDLILIAPRVE